MAKVETERFFGKKGIIIMIRDGNKMVSAIFKDKKNADKFNRNKPADVKKLLQLAKKTKFPKAIDEAKKYLYKKDALTDYFKGKLSAKELDKIAKDNFGVGIATKKELSSFLSNKFTQDVMSDTYGIPSGTLVKRVRGLMKFAEGIGEDKSEFKDTEGAMAKSQLERSMKYANMIYKIIDNVGKGGEVSFPAWVQTKMTKSMDYLQSVYNYLDGKDGLDDKFQENIDRNFRTYADDEGDDEGPVDENHSDIENEKLKKISAALKVASKMHLDQSKQIDKITADEEMEEGQKRYNQKDGVGKSKYVISYHDGKKKHKDGSDFFDIQIFRNKKDLAKFVNALHKGGYKYGFGESINENEQYVAYATKGNKVVKTVRDSEYNDKLFSKFKKDMERKGLKVHIDLVKNRKVVRQVYKTMNEAKVETERFFGKKGIIIMIRDGNKMVSAIFKDKKNADKFNRNNPSDVKKLLQLAKKTKFPKAIDEKTYGISDDNPVQFEAKYNYKADALTAYFKGKIDAKELDSIARNQFKSGIATKKELSNFLSNKFTQDVMSDTYGIPAGTLVKRVRGLMKFAEGISEDKKQVKDLVKKVKFEKIFYDVLSTMEKKFGKRKYRMWLEKSLKDFGENPKHYDYRTNAAIEEKLFQLGKK